MTGSGHLIAASLFLGLVVTARLLTTRPAVRVLGPRVRRLGRWAWDRLNPEEEVDPDVAELRLIQRRQQLDVHLARVRRLVATDEAMSATRQIGNRLAYAGLLREIARLPDPDPAPAPAPAPSSVRYDHRRRSNVEVLEIGWR